MNTDIVKPEPKTYFMSFANYLNHAQTKLVTDFHLGKKIPIRWSDDIWYLNDDNEWKKCNHEDADYYSVSDVIDYGDDGDGTGYHTQDIFEERLECATCGARGEMKDGDVEEWMV